MFLAESIYWLTLCIYHEARGEPEEGQEAVAHVILTRSMQRQKTIREVIQEPYQFSWYSDGKPDDIKDHDIFVICMRSAMRALDCRLGGRTMDGIDHYHAVYVSPSWAKRMTKVMRVGDHIFYNSRS